MSITPAPQAPAASSGVSVFSLLRQYSKPYWKSIALTIVLSLLGTTLASLMPLVMAPILDIAMGRKPIFSQGAGGGTWLDFDLNNAGQIIMSYMNASESNSFHLIVLLSALFFAASLVSNFLIFLSQFTGRSIQARTARDLQNHLFSHILSLPMSFFYARRSGELISCLERDTGATTSGMDKISRYLITAPLQIAFYAYLLVKTNVSLALVALLSSVAHYAITRSLSGRVKRSVRDQYSIYADQSVRLQEAILGIRLVKSYAAENFEIRKFRELSARLVFSTLRQFVYENIQDPLRALTNQFVLLFILVFSAYEMLNGRMEPTGFLLFIYIGQRLVGSIKLLGDTLATMQVTAATAERLVELLRLRPRLKGGHQTIDSFQTSIKLENVSFSYQDTDVLTDISLEIRRGEMLAIVGPSGAGKSTLVDLILRLHDPQQGCISIDGTDIRSFRLESLRRLFGVVSQETTLFNTSVFDNIAYGRDGLSEAEVHKAMEMANAVDFIASLPQGLQTLIGDRGVRLSGGQRQRLAIARAVAASPQILVMDEATSALDSESENLVQEAIDRVIKDSTAIVIAHRLSTVMHATRIVVLDQGRIVDIGTHEALLGRCALYARLCSHQFVDPTP
ncbi:MAG: ABC transporter ATP-binding protein [Alphaproteobacteria bacterium]|nr:ABC transporter ATP-binding protein [Alphaproteobacteria bacterium]